ncbi:hypothetical protein ACRXCV_00185 (plasmid) [Halobacteriovorax sp. GFR7]|uniref:hypothetical protein n=1 Tax=unclassified Halobacteriovorax TaxID=2639665 RepID=UPI003D95341C
MKRKVTKKVTPVKKRMNTYALMALLELIQKKRDILEKHLDYELFYDHGNSTNSEGHNLGDALPDALAIVRGNHGKHPCGTSMCLAGFSAMEGSGLLDPSNSKGWMDYTARVFWLDPNADIYYGSNEVVWDFLFGTDWEPDVDFTIKRIEFVIAYDTYPQGFNPELNPECYIELYDAYKNGADLMPRKC